MVPVEQEVVVETDNTTIINYPCDVCEFSNPSETSGKLFLILNIVV